MSAKILAEEQARAFARCAASEDMRAGVSAFVE